jgi:hypothetical protein
MIAMTGSRVGRSRSIWASTGARGWWSLSGSGSHWLSQTALAKHYAPTSIIEPGGIIVLLLAGVLFNGLTGAVLALLAYLGIGALFNRPPPDGFVCLRCGCEFRPGIGATSFVSRSK